MGFQSFGEFPGGILAWRRAQILAVNVGRTKGIDQFGASNGQ